MIGIRGRWIQLLAFFQEFFQGAKSIVMQTSIVFGLKFQDDGGGGGKSFWGGHPCGRKPGFRQYYVIIKFCE